MGKRKLITERDIWKAQAFVRTVGATTPSYLPREDQENLVRIYYPNLKGTPWREVPEEQLYSVCKRLYDQAFRLVHQTEGVLEEQLSFIR